MTVDTNQNDTARTNTDHPTSATKGAQSAASPDRPGNASRRRFLANVTGASTTLLVGAGVHAETSAKPSTSAADTVRIGLVGAGGRGGGAVIDSLNANENVTLAAIADFDAEAPARLVKNLQRRFQGAIDVPTEKLYSGLDGYKRILEDPAIDVVLFATPPGFRPGHLLDAVDAGKHIFAEKPSCVDPAGYRRCLQADAKARGNQTCIVTGTQYRRQTNYVEAIRRIHEGQIGDVVSATSRYCSSGIWYRPRANGTPDTEYQIRNWMHFIWLSGDQITEQAVHNIDLMNWLMQGPPVDALACGGRFTRPDDSEMWDNMAIDYRYAGDKFISMKCRQIPGTQSENSTVVYGTRGTATILGVNGGASLVAPDGQEIWSMKGDIQKAYQQEHKDLVDAVRAGVCLVELEETAKSSLTAVMGRMAAYTGQYVRWDFLTDESDLDLMPAKIDLTASRSSSYAIPGKTKLT